MALIVDDTVDVWQEDLANLCIIRRFVGDSSDDGLQRLSWQLQEVHREYYSTLDEFRLDDQAEYLPPDVRTVLQSIRGSLLEGCHIALTGVVPDQSEETLDQQPLCSLIRLYGAQLTMDVATSTHLVARKKDGWMNSSKIRRALQRCQVPHAFAMHAPAFAISQPCRRSLPVVRRVRGVYCFGSWCLLFLNRENRLRVSIVVGSICERCACPQLQLAVLGVAEPLACAGSGRVRYGICRRIFRANG